MRNRSFSSLPARGARELVCTYCARSVRPLAIVDTPVFADCWFAGDWQLRRARATVPACGDCASDVATLQEQLLAGWSGASDTPLLEPLGAQRWTDRLVRALHRVELHAPLPRHASIDCVQLPSRHDVSRFDRELDFEYRLPAPGLAYWFARSAKHVGGSVWFVSIRHRALLFAVVPFP